MFVNSSALFESSSCLADDVDPRVLNLSTILSVPLPHVIGTVELLRIWSSMFVPKRNIGKYADDVIAQSIDWLPNQGQFLISAFCEVGWVNRDPEQRLLLVGWRWRRGNKFTRRRDRIRAAGGEPNMRLRRKIFERDGFQCRHCATGHDLTIDHVIPIAADGLTEESNLQTLCRPRNSRKRDSILG